MFEMVEQKVAQLVMLSQEHAAVLLVKHVDRLPAATVVPQLRSNRRLLHW
jgi:hypothetical protein